MCTFCCINLVYFVYVLSYYIIWTINNTIQYNTLALGQLAAAAAHKLHSSGKFNRHVALVSQHFLLSTEPADCVSPLVSLVRQCLIQGRTNAESVAGRMLNPLASITSALKLLSNIEKLSERMRTVEQPHCTTRGGGGWGGGGTQQTTHPHANCQPRQRWGLPQRAEGIRQRAKCYTPLALASWKICRFQGEYTDGTYRDPPWPSGYDAWLPSVSSQVRVSAGSPGVLAWLLYKCSALWRAVYCPSATERPLGTIREE